MMSQPNLSQGYEPLSVAILAGGKSRRMGSPKALLRLEPEGPTLVELVANVVRPLSGDVFIVGGETAVAELTSLPLFQDHYDDAGPLGGIATALEVAEHPRCLVVSCDMPYLSLPALLAMRYLHMTGDALVPTVHARSRQGGEVAFQTLHAIYRKSCLPHILAEVEALNLQTISWFAKATIQALPAKDLMEYDHDLLTFFSVNTPEALDLARHIAARFER